MPSAVCTGPSQLRIAAALSPLVYALLALCSPVAWPVSLLLDLILGTEPGNNGKYKRGEVRAIMKMQRERVHSSGPFLAEKRSSMENVTLQATSGVVVEHMGEQSAELSDDELAIINGVLDIRSKTAQDAMVWLGDAFMLDMETVLNIDTLARIVASGHSRVPVYRRGSPHNVCGLLLVKKLCVINPEDNRKISTLGLRYPLPVRPEMPLLELLNEMQRGTSHMAIVCDRPELVEKCMRTGRDIPPHVHMAGICTLEDILELVRAHPFTTVGCVTGARDFAAVACALMVPVCR